MKAVRVLLVEDHNLVRAGIRSLLGELPWVEVTGEAADGREVDVGHTSALEPVAVSPGSGGRLSPEGA